MKLELVLKKSPVVIGVQPVPRLLIWTRYNVRTLSFHRLACAFVGHRWNGFEYPKYSSKWQSRQCQRCGKWQSKEPRP